MADSRTTYYCSTREVTELYKMGSTQSAVSLQADSGSSQTNKDRIFLTLANTANVVPGDHVRVYDDASTMGEIVQVQSITEDGDDSYLETVSDMTGNYTTNNSAKFVLISYFTRTTKPSSWDINNIINRMEDYIDEYTHTAWRLRTAPAVRPHLTPQREGWRNSRIFVRVYLPHRNIKTFASGTDTMYVWDGSSETEYVANKTNARSSGDYWLCEERGFVDIYGDFLRHYTASVRFDSYRYGLVDSNDKPNPPKDITDACTKLVVAELLSMDYHVSNLPGGDIGVDPIAGRIERLKAEALEILDRHKDMGLII